MILRLIIKISLICMFAVNAVAQETGEFLIRTTPAEILGSDADRYNDYISKNNLITWEIYVPENYDATKPAGIMVFAGAPTIVREPSGWLSVLKDKNIIWVAARRSDNGASIHQKVLLAMLSVPLVQSRYSVDENRIYITGEGRTAARVALDYPHIFSGAIFIGDRLWEDNAEAKMVNVLDHRYVFVTKENTAFPRGTREAYYKFRNAGVSASKIVHIKRNHRYNRPRFAESIDYLDFKETGD